MPINIEKLDRMLAIITAKDRDKIMSDRVYLPFMGNAYTRAELDAWLGTRITLLQVARNSNENHIIQERTTLLSTLNPNDRSIADLVISNSTWPANLIPSGKDGYEKLVKIILYCYITSP